MAALTPRTPPARRVQRSRTPEKAMRTTVEVEPLTIARGQTQPLRRQIAVTALRLAEEQARARLRLARSRSAQPLPQSPPFAQPPPLELLAPTELLAKTDAIKELTRRKVAQAIGAKWPAKVKVPTTSEDGHAGGDLVGSPAERAAVAVQTAAVDDVTSSGLRGIAGPQLSPILFAAGADIRTDSQLRRRPRGPAADRRVAHAGGPDDAAGPDLHREPRRSSCAPRRRRHTRR
ncbi:unnamed protein product [Prorocentrum cordatum]|uniref:Uncharacterized protein n=1 Tax=Prorocentrum cordatum TaxID=2364126 RepID=A0ABN9V973_9DINO|nr:unnamed protein product [Polarella glacialis]